MVGDDSYNSETVDRPAVFDIVMSLVTKQEINLRYCTDFRNSSEKNEDRELIGLSIELKEVVTCQQQTCFFFQIFHSDDHI
jgi:hypothetical protein